MEPKPLTVKISGITVDTEEAIVSIPLIEVTGCTKEFAEKLTEILTKFDSTQFVKELVNKTMTETIMPLVDVKISEAIDALPEREIKILDNNE